MKSYPLLIDGKDRDHGQWTYTVRASAMIADPIESFNLKRALDLGKLDPEEAPEGIVVGRTALGDRRDNGEAVEAASRAHRAYLRIPFEARSREISLRYHELIVARARELVEVLIWEGHPRRLAEWEVLGIIEGTHPELVSHNFNQLRSELRQGERRIILQRKPDGVVCLNPPQNAAGSNSALGFGALAAGNTLVVKAPRSTPLSVMFLYREIVAPLLAECGAPPGTLNLVCGNTKEILRQWIQSPLVNTVMFFGDSVVGTKIGVDCAAAGKKAVLELSGNDAIVHPEVADELLDLLLDRVEEIRPGFPEDPEVLLSPVLKADRYFTFLAEAREGGARILSGGQRLDVKGQPSPEGFFLEPAVVRIDGLAEARRFACVREETFFPLLPVIVPASEELDNLLDRVIDFLNGNEYGLRNSLWARDEEVIERFIEEVTNAGLLKVNESHIGFAAPLATHGGTGLTGGPHGELHYPALRTTHLQGVAAVPSGTFSPQQLKSAVSLPQDVEMV